MAILERQGSPRLAPWITLRGKLRGDDEGPLGKMAAEPDGFDQAVLDMRSLRELTDDGCQALRRLAGRLFDRGRRLKVFYLLESPIAERLNETGLLEDPHIEWAGVRDEPTAGEEDDADRRSRAIG